MRRKLFCEISPLTYRLSVQMRTAQRHLADFAGRQQFANVRQTDALPVRIYAHRSLIRRKLGHVDPHLQENKAVNLALSCPRISGVLIRPGETFSFFALNGNCRAADGYLPGLTVTRDGTAADIGGGLCQMTNLIHWMVLHTPLCITEHHHHDQFDLFPDYGRQLPFGCGTSIFANYIDYRFYNPTPRTYQLLLWITDTHLCGELRADAPQPESYHVYAEDEHFSRAGSTVYRNNVVVRETIDKRTGNRTARTIIKVNHARVLYDTAGLPIRECLSAESPASASKPAAVAVVIAAPPALSSSAQG